MNPLERIALTSPDGASVAFCPYGAHVTHWTPAGGSEQLFLSDAAVFREGTAIRGGVPVIFPQFGGAGGLPKHGFARTLPWVVEPAATAGQAATARLSLCDSASTRQLWPYAFQVALAVEAYGSTLAIELEVTNPDLRPFTFTAALHTYLRVARVSDVELAGLAGLPFIDTVGGIDRPCQPEVGPVRFGPEIDRVYPDAKSPLVLREGMRSVTVEATGFPDCVVWNPGADLGAKMTDLEPDGHQRFVCVEAALVSPFTLSPGQVWRGQQVLTASGPEPR